MIYIYATDTVWGIGAPINDENAVAQIANIKKTGLKKPTSLLFSSVEQIRKWVNFPATLTDEWLKTYFTMESSLALSKQFCIREIPSWVISDSLYLSIRCLESPWIKELCREGPITTTSLNISGENPIKNRDDAYDFYKQIEKQTLFCDSPGHKLSGNPSTMICLKEDDSYHVWRRGTLFNKVEKHLELLST